MHTVSLHSAGLSLDACIKCNICTSYCPVSQVTDRFPGPKYAAPQSERFRQIGQPRSPDASVDYCSGCRVCNEVCPTGVRIAEINARAAEWIESTVHALREDARRSPGRSLDSTDMRSARSGDERLRRSNAGVGANQQ